MNDLLFDVPWWIPTLLAVIGISLWVNGNKLQAANLRRAGLAILLLGIGWFLLSYFVDTDKEKVQKQSRQLIQAAVDGDWGKFQGLMEPTATFIAGPISVNGSEKVTRLATDGAELVKLKFARVSDLKAEQTGTFIATTFVVVSQQDNYNPIVKSAWRLDWTPIGSQWKLREMRCLELDGRAPEELLQGAHIVPR